MWSVLCLVGRWLLAKRSMRSSWARAGPFGLSLDGRQSGNLAPRAIEGQALYAL